MVSWAHDPEKRWGALPLGESPKYLPSLPEPLSSAVALLSGNAHCITDAGRGSESKAFSAGPLPKPEAVLPPDTAASGIFWRRYL